VDTPDRQAAEEGGVMLIEAARAPGQAEASLLSRKPQMPDDWLPDLVIGHGRITGPDAAALVSDHYYHAERMHLFHMAPDEIEWFKEGRENDAGERAEERTRIERQLGAGARYAVAVGPRLYNRYLADFTGNGRPPLRLDPGFDSKGTTPIGLPGGEPHSVLLVGRAEDDTLKGLDIAAAALGTVFRRWRGTEFEMLVRGAPAGESEELRRRLRKWAKAPAMKSIVRPYTSLADDLAGDYRRASLVLMPSRAEGFGLVGSEAICAGVPVLVSSESGLAGLLRERLDQEEYLRIVVPVTDNVKADVVAWANAIERVLLNRAGAFATAAKLQATLAESANWATSIDKLTAQMDARETG
jgi:glycosyltransferase involved in cell wall biosynthesis